MEGFSQVKANSIGADGGPHSFERRNKLEQGLDHQLLDLGLGIDRFREVEVQHIPSGGNRPGKALGQHNVGWRRGFGLKALLGKPQTCRSGEDVPAENVQDRKQCDQTRVWRRSMRPSLDEFGCSASGKGCTGRIDALCWVPQSLCGEYVLAGKREWAGWDSNPRLTDYESAALGR